MTDFLNAHSPRRFDRFALLDSKDWMNRVQVAALWTAIDRAAAPGARVVFRTAAAASPVEEAVPLQLRRSWRRDEAMSQALMPLDRSAIYGGLHIYRRD